MPNQLVNLMVSDATHFKVITVSAEHTLDIIRQILREGFSLDAISETYANRGTDDSPVFVTLPDDFKVSP